MSAVDDWYTGNNHYLAVSLTWLRLVLARAADTGTAPRSASSGAGAGAVPGEAPGTAPDPPGRHADDLAVRPEVTPVPAKVRQELPREESAGIVVITTPQPLATISPAPAASSGRFWGRRRHASGPQAFAAGARVIVAEPDSPFPAVAAPGAAAGSGSGSTAGSDSSADEPSEVSSRQPDPGHSQDPTHEWPSGSSSSSSSTAAQTQPPLPPRVARDWDGELAAAAAAVQAAAAISPAPALERLGDALGLSDFERHVLLLCLARGLDTGIGAMYEAVHGVPWPTFGLAFSLFDDPAWEALSPDRPLRHWRLVELTQPDGHVVTDAALSVDERILNAVKGLHHIDERLMPLLELVAAPADPLPPSQHSVVEEALTVVSRAVPQEPPPVIQLVGPHPGARETVAASIAAHADHDLYRLPGRLLPTAAADLDLVARLWHREAVLAPVALFIDEDDLDEAPADRHVLGSFLHRSGGLVLLGGRDVTADLPGPSVVLDATGPTAAEQQQIWVQALGADSGADVGGLVAQFDLDPDTIRSVVRYAGPLPEGPDRTRPLWTGARRALRPRLESAAQRVEPVATWDALVLPEPELSLLHQIAGQVAQRSQVYADWGFGSRMNRGLGITALFAGESGTGKSMAAEVLANDLDLEIYRIDLSTVVSKYIGETEKNLRRLFDAAETGGVILFFDEADALFGKRSDVKDAHDRYANIEVNFLLQRMETYRGLAILATNMRSALDRAFTRRLRFIVPFPFPRPADRARMWQLAFPAATPLGPLDIARLSRIDLTGAGIAGAAMNAAFLAAAARHPVGMSEVLTAARNELRKLERPINEADFRLATQEVPA